MHARIRIMRLLEDQLVASDCDFQIGLDIDPSTPMNDAKDRLRAMRLWLDQFLNNSVAYDAHTSIDTTLLEQISNHIMMCPDTPHDYLLLALVHAKLSAIGSGLVMVKETSMAADTGEGFSSLATGNADEWLPSMDDWVGPRKFHARPWWDRQDASMVDVRPEPGEDLSVIPDLGPDLVEMVGRDVSEEPKQQAEIIKPSFKPRVILPDD